MTHKQSYFVLRSFFVTFLPPLISWVPKAQKSQMPFLGDFAFYTRFCVIWNFVVLRKSNAEFIFMLLIIFCPLTLNGYVQRKINVIITIYCVRPKIVKCCFQSTQKIFNRFWTRALKTVHSKKFRFFVFCHSGTIYFHGISGFPLPEMWTVKNPRHRLRARFIWAVGNVAKWLVDRATKSETP